MYVGMGGREIEENLLIKGKVFIMNRGDYDGSECWILRKANQFLPQVGRTKDVTKAKISDE